MVSCVASVDVQLSVEESPALMEVGLACSETVGERLEAVAVEV